MRIRNVWRAKNPTTTAATLPCAFKSGPYYKGRGSLKLLPALLPILKPAVFDLQPGSCYTFWSIIQTLSPAPAYKKNSLSWVTQLWKDPPSGIIRSKKATALCISAALIKRVKPWCMPPSPTGQRYGNIPCGKMRSCCCGAGSGGWSRTIRGDMRTWEETSRGPGRDVGSLGHVLCTAVLQMGWTCISWIMLSLGSQDSEGGNTNNVTFGCSPPGCMLLRVGSCWDLSSQLQELTLREWGTFCDTYFLTARPRLSLASLVSASLSIICLRMGFWRKSTGRLKFPPELRLRLRPLVPSFPQSSRIDLIFLWMAEQLWSNSVLDCKMAYRHLYSAGKPCLILTKYVGIFSDVCLSCCCCSVVQSCLALWSMDCSMPGFLPCP